MKTITGINELKDTWRKLKLFHGDHRGLSNKFELAERFQMDEAMIAFNSMCGNRAELYAEIIGYGRCWTMAELVKAAVDTSPQEIDFGVRRYDKGDEKPIATYTWRAG